MKKPKSAKDYMAGMALGAMGLEEAESEIPETAQTPPPKKASTAGNGKSAGGRGKKTAKTQAEIKKEVGAKPDKQRIRAPLRRPKDKAKAAAYMRRYRAGKRGT